MHNKYKLQIKRTITNKYPERYIFGPFQAIFKNFKLTKEQNK